MTVPDGSTHERDADGSEAMARILAVRAVGAAATSRTESSVDRPVEDLHSAGSDATK